MTARSCDPSHESAAATERARSRQPSNRGTRTSTKTQRVAFSFSGGGFPCTDAAQSKQKRSKVVTLSAGVGLSEVDFVNKSGETFVIKCLNARRGPVCGLNYELKVWQSMVLFLKGRDNKETLVCFIENILNVDSEPRPNQYKIFQYDIDMCHWKCATIKTSRTIDSVVLPASTKDKITDSFLNQEACDFYTSHGIPYKRSYLFYGVPRAGKTCRS
jgi:hypothetical protein